MYCLSWNKNNNNKCVSWILALIRMMSREMRILKVLNGHVDYNNIDLYKQGN